MVSAERFRRGHTFTYQLAFQVYSKLKLLAFVSWVLLSLLPCLLLLTSPSANYLSNSSAFENHVFRKSCWKLLSNHLLFSFKCSNLSSTSISFCSFWNIFTVTLVFLSSLATSHTASLPDTFGLLPSWGQLLSWCPILSTLLHQACSLLVFVSSSLKQQLIIKS